MADDEEIIPPKEEPPKEETTTTPAVDPPKKTSKVDESADEILSQVEEAADRLEKANEEAKSLLAQQAAAKTEATLGGTADAGTQGKTADEKADENAKAFLKGTGFEDELFPEKKV